MDLLQLLLPLRYAKLRHLQPYACPPPPLRGMVSSLVFASTENSGCEKIEEDQIAVATTAYILHPAYTYLGSKANANE